MNCAFDQDLLTGYYDGELDGRDRASVEEHIAACSSCLRSLGELKTVATQVKALPRVSAPASVATVIASQTLSPLGSRARAWFQASVAVAALALVSVSVLIVSTKEQPPAAGIARVQAPPAPENAKNSRPSEPNLKELKDLGAELKGAAPDADRSRTVKDEEKLKKSLERAHDANEAQPGQDHKRDDEQLADKKKQADPAAAPAPTKSAPKDLDKHNESDDDFKKREEMTRKSEPKPQGAKLDAPAAKPAVLVIRAGDLGKARAEVEALMKDFGRRGATLAFGAKELGNDANVKDRCMTVELSDAELESLKKLLTSLKSVEIAQGSFAEEEARAVAWRRSLDDLRKKEKESAADGKFADADSGTNKGGTRGAPAAPPKQPAGRDPGTPAPESGAAEPPPAAEPAEKKAEGGGAAGGYGGKSGGRTAGAVARIKYILVFEEKITPPATKDK